MFTSCKATKHLCKIITTTSLFVLATISSTTSIANNLTGLGNLSYSPNEIMKPMSFINRNNGMPATYPFRKTHGLNTGILHNGYFVTLFAPDSGLGPGGFLIYDVSDPRNIKLVKRVYDPEGSTREFREAHSFGVHSENGKDYISIQTINGIEIWDFTSIDDIKQVSKLALPGVDSGDYTDVAWQLWWQAPYLYVSGGNRGVYVVDTTDITQPKLAERGNGRANPIPLTELGGFRVGPIFSMGNQLVISSMDLADGFASLDISDPVNPVLLTKTADMPDIYYATCFDGNNFHVSMRGAGAKMRSYSLANPNKFELINDRLVIDEMLYCATQDNMVFQGTQEKVHKVNVTDRDNYVEVTNGALGVNLPDHGQVTTFGNLIFVGNDHGTGSAFMPHQTQPDSTAPKVTNISPRNGAVNQSLTTRIGVGMTDSIYHKSVNAQNFIVQDEAGNQLTGKYSVQLGIVNFTPDKPLEPNTTYKVLLPKKGLMDYAGNTTEQEFIATFTTGNGASNTIVSANHWQFDGNLTDKNNINNGSYLNSNNNKFENNALSMVDAPIELEKDISELLGGTASLSFYIKTDQAGHKNPWQAPGLFGRDNFWGVQDIFWGWLDDQGKLRLSVGNDAGISSIQPINDNQWHHVVLSRNADTGELAMYVDGTLTQKVTAQTGVYGGKWYNRFNTLGQIEGSSRQFEGMLDEVKTYAYPLSQAEVTTLANTTTVTLADEYNNSVSSTNEATQFNALTRAGTGNAQNTQYRWNFGDGNSSDYAVSPMTSYQYSKAGHYQVILEITETIAGVQETRRISFTHTVTNPLTAQQPTHSTTITGDAETIYNVNPDNGTVTALNADNMSKQWETHVGKKPQTLAIAPNGNIWVTVQEENAVVVLNKDGTTNSIIKLGYGSAPYGITFAPDNSYALVSLEGGQTLAKLDTSGNVLGRIELTGDLRGVAITADSSTAYVTQFMSDEQGGYVHVVNTEQMTLEQTIALHVDMTTVDGEDRGRGVPNYLNQIVISPDGMNAIIPSKKDNIVRGLSRDGQALTHDLTVRSILSTIDVANNRELFNEQLDFNDRAPARAVAYSPNGDYVFVVFMESNKVEILDAYTGSVRGAMNNTGNAPQGIYIDGERGKAYVHNFLSRNVVAYDIASTLQSVSFAPRKLAETVTVANETMAESALQGKRVFYNALDARMSRDGYMSCASCHADGGDDGMVWDFTDRGQGLRNTTDLRGRMGMGHGNVHWTANFDEIQDFENDIRAFFGGTGFMSDADFANSEEPLGNAKAGKSIDLDNLASYMASLTDFKQSNAKAPFGMLSSEAEQGKQLFDLLNCATCHSGSTLQDNQKHDVGTGMLVDTPTLHSVANTAPYFHDGRAKTLRQVFELGHGNTDTLTNEQLDQLTEYVKSFDGTDDKFVEIKSNYNHYCMTASKLTPQSGQDTQEIKITARICTGSDNQQWRQDALGRWHNKANDNFCMQANAQSNEPLTAKLCNGFDNQKFDKVTVDTGMLLASKTNPNLVIDLNRLNLQVIMWERNGGKNQVWQMGSGRG